MMICTVARICTLHIKCTNGHYQLNVLCVLSHLLLSSAHSLHRLRIVLIEVSTFFKVIIVVPPFCELYILLYTSFCDIFYFLQTITQQTSSYILLFISTHSLIQHTSRYCLSRIFPTIDLGKSTKMQIENQQGHISL